MTKLHHRIFLVLASQWPLVCAYPDFTKCSKNVTTLIKFEECKRICGTGSGPWPAAETIQRFALWLLPELILLANFHFPPLPTKDTAAIAARIIANPIGSIWCLLIRQEAQRLFLERALQRDERNGSDLAIIWSAYEELGEPDAPRIWDSQNILEELGEPDVPSSRELQNILEEHRYYYMATSQQLVLARSESSSKAWFAVVGFAGALIAAFVRTHREKMNNQTSHSIALVSLLFFSIPVVLLSGYIGVFTTLSAPVESIEELRRQDRVSSAFPPLVYCNQYAS